MLERGDCCMAAFAVDGREDNNDEEDDVEKEVAAGERTEGVATEA